jgi:hypothetical protein
LPHLLLPPMPPGWPHLPLPPMLPDWQHSLQPMMLRGWRRRTQPRTLPGWPHSPLLCLLRRRQPRTQRGCWRSTR